MFWYKRDHSLNPPPRQLLPFFFLIMALPKSRECHLLDLKRKEGVLTCLKFCASMWTKEESDEIQRIAKETVPGVKTIAIPHGLQVEKGPGAVVEFLKEQWPGLVDG